MKITEDIGLLLFDNSEEIMKFTWRMQYSIPVCPSIGIFTVYIIALISTALYPVAGYIMILISPYTLWLGTL